MPRYDAQGRFAGYIGSCVDVTDLLNKDKALWQSEERMRLAADAVNLGILGMGPRNERDLGY